MEDKQDVDIIRVQIQHESKSKWDSDKDICAPKLFFLKSKQVKIWEFKLLIFKQFYHFIDFPEEIKLKIEKVANLDERIELAFKLCFEESAFGKENLYSFKHKRSTYYTSNPDPDVD